MAILDGINWLGYIAPAIKWLGYILISVAILLIFVAAYYFFAFKYKVTVFPLYGSGKDGTFAFGKPKTNKIMWNKTKTAWKTLYPLFNSKEIEPFDSEYIYPGNQLYAFELNNDLIPGRINIQKTENEIRGEINPVPYYIRNWQSLTYKKLQLEFSTPDFWTENKHYFYALIAILISCALCGATIYFTYKYAAGSGNANINALTDAIQNFGNIPGK